MKTIDLEKKTERFQLRLTPDVLGMLRALALSNGMSKSEFVCRLIAEAWFDQTNLFGPLPSSPVRYDN